ncbi:MAG TPA: PDZ domain-containing protein [Bryobacteraceae bacterium]|nr:PDZ domain-containing protein [Bryobacteraceae bacterium]
MKQILGLATAMALGAAGLAAQGNTDRKQEHPQAVIVELGELGDLDDVIEGAVELARLAPLPFPAELQDLPPEPPAPPDVQVLLGPGFGKGSYLGVGVVDVDTETARDLKLKEERGVKVSRVNEGSPAEKAGIKENDVILEFNGERVEGVEQFVRMVREVPAGRSVKMLVWRGGQTMTVSASVGNRKEVSREWESKFRRDMEKMREEMKGQRFEFRMPDMPQIHTTWRTSRLGVEAESLTPQLAEFFGVKKGVLVRSVTKDSAAEKAGIKAGDVIVKVDGEEVDSPNDISAKIRSIEGSKGVPVVVVRNRSEMSFQVVIEAAPAARRMAPRATRPAPAPPAQPAPPPRYVVSPREQL